MFSCVQLILKCIAVLTFVKAVETELCAAEGAFTNRLNLMVQVSDFRRFPNASIDLEKMIKEGKAFLEVRGIIYLKGGIIPETASFSVDAQTNLEQFLKLSGIELEAVNGVQLRLIKRDIIIQTPRFHRRSPEHYSLMKEMLIEPGDVVIITGKEP